MLKEKKVIIFTYLLKSIILIYLIRLKINNTEKIISFSSIVDIYSFHHLHSNFQLIIKYLKFYIKQSQG
jgi:hypothetical protein